MYRLISKLTWTAIGLLFLASPLMAQNIKLSGYHFNLNIIGQEKEKDHPAFTDTSRHTIFVPLNNQNGIGTKIFLVPGSDFYVCDGNGFDAATDCDGITKGTGAVFQLPCNTNLPTVNPELVPCDVPDAQQASYSVW